MKNLFCFVKSIQSNPLTDKCAFAANVILALLLPFTLIGRIAPKLFDPPMALMYFALCIINRPNRTSRKAFLNVKQLIKDAKDPKRLIKREVYCAGLYGVRLLLRIAMIGIVINIILSPIPFVNLFIKWIRPCAILYVFLLSNLNLGVRAGGRFGGRLSQKVKIFLNVIWLFASAMGFYLSSKAGLWKYFFSSGKPDCTLTCYFLTTLLFVQIGLLFFELTIGRETS